MDLVIGGDRLRYLQEINVAMGLQKKILSYDKVADASLAEEALRLLTARGL
jgi:hypothetical protein